MANFRRRLSTVRLCCGKRLSCSRNTFSHSSLQSGSLSSNRFKKNETSAFPNPLPRVVDDLFRDPYFAILDVGGSRVARRTVGFGVEGLAVVGAKVGSGSNDCE